MKLALRVPIPMLPGERIEVLRARLVELGDERDLYRSEWHASRTVLQRLVSAYQATPHEEIPECWRAAIALVEGR